jgi:hypothetical protein
LSAIPHKQLNSFWKQPSWSTIQVILVWVSGEFGSVDVKRRLIELWHQSLERSKKSRDWTAFSNLNSAVSKKATYAAETNH